MLFEVLSCKNNTEELTLPGQTLASWDSLVLISHPYTYQKDHKKGHSRFGNIMMLCKETTQDQKSGLTAGTNLASLLKSSQIN